MAHLARAHVGKINKISKTISMYSTKIFSGLCFFTGLLLLAVGAYMNFNNILSTGQSYKTRLGTSMNAESIDGNGALFFGILILIVSLVSNRIYISQKKERNKRLEEENTLN